ncbi:hypothetical protein ACJIZ3_011938 [Penstemon smallii]|uniref:Uncharacterized protein n=1 Tax=Penstemon smallii TaxID=265156 RepID=A0ABD3UKJ4_9LAMI
MCTSLLRNVRRMRHTFRLLPQNRYPVNHSSRFSGTDFGFLAARSTVFSCNVDTSIRTFNGQASFRYSTVSERKHELASTIDILSLIQSSLQEPEGPSMCWMNKVADNKNLFKEDGIFFVLVGEYHENSFTSDQNRVKMFEKVKSLQQRYPFLQVLAVQYSKSICLNDMSAHLLRRIIKDYFTFPILLSHRNIFEEANGPYYIISKGFQNPLVYPENDVDLKVLDKAIHDLSTHISKEARVLKSPWVKPIEVVKEPDVCHASRNLLFSFPGCISAEESGNRLFLSDVNHHRIIVFNSSGKILDAIGSSPGFEDGEFEIAKLMRPAASFYQPSEDCLYFVDSENHAIRRADMEKRVVETVFPPTDSCKKNKGLWKWIVDKIWTERDIKLKSEEFNSDSFLFPWHLLKSPNDGLFVLNRSFGTLWIIDLESGIIKEVVKESSKILEICGPMILEKTMPLTQISAGWLQQQTDSNCSFKGIPYAGLMSSVTSCQDYVVFCDTVGQKVLKFSKESGSPTSFGFSNFGILGLPYWLSTPLERVYATHGGLSGIDLDHLQHFRLLPGRVDIEFDINIPQNTDLVELPQEGCIWRQARGAAAEVLGIDNKAESTEKMGLAQQWYDEIDNLSFIQEEEEEEINEEENRLAVDEMQEGKVRFSCTINTSPGTSEVIIYAALYLRLKKNIDLPFDSQEKKAERIADVLDPKRRFRKDLVKLLTMTNRDLEEQIFIKPLNVRLKFNSLDHPKADNSKDIILTESSVKVNINL